MNKQVYCFRFCPLGGVPFTTLLRVVQRGATVLLLSTLGDVCTLYETNNKSGPSFLFFTHHRELATQPQIWARGEGNVTCVGTIGLLPYVTCDLRVCSSLLLSILLLFDDGVLLITPNFMVRWVRQYSTQWEQPHCNLVTHGFAFTFY